MGDCAPMFATVPDWWTSKCAGAVWTPKRSVPPRFAAGSGLTVASCAEAEPGTGSREATTAALAAPARLRKVRRSLA